MALPFEPRKVDSVACIPVPDINFLRIRLPVGIEIRSLNLIEAIQPALTPLVPFYRILRIILAIVAVIESIPDAITSLQLEQLIAALIILADELGILAELAPALSLAYTCIDIIELLIKTLDDVRFVLIRFLQQLKRIDDLRNAALDVDLTLLDILNCELDGIFQEMDNVTEKLKALGALIEVTNLFLQLVGVPEEFRIPSFSDLVGAEVEDAITSIEDIIKTLQMVRDHIPLP